MTFGQPGWLLLLVAPVLLAVWELTRRYPRMAIPIDHGEQPSGRWLGRIVSIAAVLPGSRKDRRVVNESQPVDDVEGPGGFGKDRETGGAVAEDRYPEEVAQAVASATQVFFESIGSQFVAEIVHVAVAGHFVSGGMDSLNESRMTPCDPAQDEERGTNVSLSENFEKAFRVGDDGLR